MSKKLMLAVVVLILPTMAIAGVTVNINAKTNTTANPVVVTLDAGTYDVTPVIDDYTAWTAWYNAAKGWLNKYSLSSDEFSAYTVGDSGGFSTPQVAFANADSTSFTLLSSGDVNFFITDSPYYDNSGGMSLYISLRENTVPVPGAILLAGLGTGLVGAIRRRYMA